MYIVVRYIHINCTFSRVSLKACIRPVIYSVTNVKRIVDYGWSIFLQLKATTPIVDQDR